MNNIEKYKAQCKYIYILYIYIYIYIANSGLILMQQN